MDGFDQTDRVSSTKPTTPIRLPRRSAADQDFLNLILSGRSPIGHKPDPDQPKDTPNSKNKNSNNNKSSDFQAHCND